MSRLGRRAGRLVSFQLADACVTGGPTREKIETLRPEICGAGPTDIDRWCWPSLVVGVLVGLLSVRRTKYISQLTLAARRTVLV